MTPKEAASYILSQKEGMKIVAACDYDRRYYIFGLSANPEKDVQTTWYYVDKRKKKYGIFNAGLDLPGFFKKMRSNYIDPKKYT